MQEITKEEQVKIIKEFSPQFIANGIAGLFASDEYESCEIKITFKKKPQGTTQGTSKT